VLSNPDLVHQLVDEQARFWETRGIEAIVGIEARGFILGAMLAHVLTLPFIPVRKSGKLPSKTLSQSYDLEYGSAEIEIHEDAIPMGCKTLIHDDLLATGGTAMGAARLVERLGGEVSGFSFLINLNFLEGERKLAAAYNVPLIYQVNY
jgi:adenine phosphoribosyltransferase